MKKHLTMLTITLCILNTAQCSLAYRSPVHGTLRYRGKRNFTQPAQQKSALANSLKKGFCTGALFVIELAAGINSSRLFKPKAQ